MQFFIQFQWLLFQLVYSRNFSSHLISITFERACEKEKVSVFKFCDGNYGSRSHKKISIKPKNEYAASHREKNINTKMLVVSERGQWMNVVWKWEFQKTPAHHYYTAVYLNVNYAIPYRAEPVTILVTYSY